MSEAKHTPTPWRLAKSAVIEIRGVSQTPVVSWSGFDDSNRTTAEHKANAAFIVRACNAHDDMVAALRRAEQFIVNAIEANVGPKDVRDHALTHHVALVEVRAAIAMAATGH